ncbi:hypothetical protein M3175_07710 [Robertmurraya korlensis]|uniref:hypothetical protein n=1 Tax=Robertmurraya korlensis TaxID=519977 RepID=UPI002041EE41|nr:hypothetical protein [Robertmurraya korlensis]MCM3600613.1 hypothetical protein [Robertmurraya korlensis]
MKERDIKPVSFSLQDPFESELLSFATDQGKFSKYVKRLIWRDMEAKKKVKKAPSPANVIHCGKNALNGFVLGQK